jgi:membrane fusion protein, multidrug efflux system
LTSLINMNKLLTGQLFVLPSLYCKGIVMQSFPSVSPPPLNNLKLIFSLCSTALMLAACSNQAPVATEDMRPVRTVTVGLSNVQAGASYAAEVRARNESRLGFRVGGKITQRLVDVGATVKQGQALARLDANDLSLAASSARAQVASAQANYELALADLKRTKSLADQNFVSSSNVDQVQTQVRAAKAQLDSAQAQAASQGNQAAYSTLVSDRTGVVTAVEAEPGQVVQSGQTVVRVATINAKGSDSDVVFNVPEQVASSLKPGAVATVSLWSAPDKMLKATVREIAPAADATTRTFPVRASLDDPQNTAPLGATATVRLDTGTQQALIVPLNAVVEKEGKAAVWIVDNGVAKRTPVVVAGPALGTSAASLAIAQGLSPGAKVITAGLHTLNEGQKVKLLETGTPAPATVPAAPVPQAAAKSE